MFTCDYSSINYPNQTNFPMRFIVDAHDKFALLSDHISQKSIQEKRKDRTFTLIYDRMLRRN